VIYPSHTPWGCAMTNRREFLHLGVAALSLPIAARAGVSPDFLAASKQPDAELLYKIFFDERFAACATFADELKRHSVQTRAIRGDITDIWFNDLYHRWKQGPAAIAGMTAPGPIFCLEMLARDAGMRVALRVDHRRLVDGRIEHEFAGPEDVLRRAADLETSAGKWPERMAEIVAQFPVERDRTARRRFAEAAVANGNDPDHLVTWVIAPARRA
jgi:hypothetical protein